MNIRKYMGNIVPVIIGCLLGVLILLYYGKICFTLNLASYSRDSIIYCLALFLVILSMIPIILPIYRYIKYGKLTRINEVTGFFDANLISDYFKHFWEGDQDCKDKADAYRNQPNDTTEKALKEIFASKISETFGRDRIKWATLFLCLAGFVVLFFAMEGGLQLARDLGGVADEKSVHFPLGLKPDITSLAAIFGAYTWITSDAIYRYRRNDFNSSDVLWYSLRLIVAIPLGEAVARFAPMQTAEGKGLDISTAGPLLAFVVSMFSFSSIQQMLGAFINRAYNLPNAVTDARDDMLIKLPGIDQGVADRLGAEGITTMAQLVGTDPVLLCSRTAIPFRCILDYVNSAILWKIVGINLLVLREFGWQGASQVIAFSKRENQTLEESIGNFNLAKQQLETDKSALDVAKRVAGAAETAYAGNPQNNTLEIATETAENLESAKMAEAKSKEDFDFALIQVQVIASQQSKEDIFKDMAEKAKMKSTAFPEIKKQIMTDPYARFIYKIGYISTALQ